MPFDMNYLESLNEEQRDAVESTEGYVRVLAGAGTGKTRALTSRYCYLVSMLGVAPANIFCMTFTNRAAMEMKNRIRHILGEDLDLGHISTIHAFCVQLLKEDAHVLNFPKNFIILDNEDEKNMLQKIFEDMNLTLREATVSRVKDEVLEGYKMKVDTYIEDFYLMDNEKLKARFETAKNRNEEIFLRYIYEQKKCFGLDFNDLINLAGYILDTFPDIREKWQDRCQYVMVDEFQDVSKKQYNIARRLSDKHQNLFIVGDPDQTIYTWRGSHVRMFLDFDKDYPSAKTIVLKLNYRSTPEILKAADSVIAHNEIRYPKELTAVRESSDKPVYYHAKSEKEEAEWIIGEIQRLAAGGEDYSKCAVLYRAHYLSRSLEEAFINADMPYRILSGVEFYSRREIKDIICYLRMLTAADDIAFLRTVNLPARKIGKKKVDFIRKYAEENSLSLFESLKQNLDLPEFKSTGAAAYIEAIERTRLSMERRIGEEHPGRPFDEDYNGLDDTLQEIMDASGYEEYLRVQGDQERLDNVAEFKRAVHEAGKDVDTTLQDFLNRIALFTNLDKDDKKNTVRLLTVHTAKGMEFPYVFICGLNEGVFPSRKAVMPEDMDEERRLAYVAMTRAKDRLYLTDSEGITNDNTFKYPSRFIFEAGLSNLTMPVKMEDSFFTRSMKVHEAAEARMSLLRNLFEEGTRVSHQVFGEGTVTALDMKQGCYRIKFDKFPTERNLMFTAPLGKA